MYADLIREHDKEVAKAVIKLKGLKNWDNVEFEGDRLYSHTNTRGRKRYIQICNSYEVASCLSQKVQGDFFKSNGSWVCLYERPEEYRKEKLIKEEIKEMTVKELEEFMREHDLIIRTLPQKTVSIHNVVHAKRGGVIMHLDDYKRDMSVSVEDVPEHLAGKFIYKVCSDTSKTHSFDLKNGVFDTIEELVEAVKKDKNIQKKKERDQLIFEKIKNREE
ncbi:hypothetical protein M2146_001144 [Lachnospiraceae bacterium PF1-22]